MSDNPKNEFERLAPDESRPGLLSDFWYFLRTNKKWWLLPILAILLLFGALLLISGSPLAPFIYTIF